MDFKAGANAEFTWKYEDKSSLEGVKIWNVYRD